MRYLCLGLVLLLTGCSQTNIAELVKSMAGDPATICVTVAYAGAIVNASRTNITNGDVACNGNGLTVKSQATSMGVPITVVPSVTVGQPTVTSPTR